MIVFYFQHKGYGGVPSLIVNFIRTLDSLGHRVKLFNYENDVIDSALKKLGVDNYELVDIEKTPVTAYGAHINADDVLVVTNFYLSLQYFFSTNPRILFYNVYPDSLAKKSFYQRPASSKDRNRRLVNELLAKHSLAFMDDTGVRAVQGILGLNIAHPQYFPVSVEVPPVNSFLARKANAGTNAIRLTYVGRSVGWKNNSIKKILDDIKALQPDHPIVINLVVDNKKSLEDFISLENYVSAQLRVNIFENIPQAELGQFLLDHSDIHFGMGTTALEGAKMGIPSILIDFSHNPFPENYSYQWLYETQHYCLGDDIETGYYVNRGKHGMKEILDSASDQTMAAALSNSSWDYVSREHNIEKNIQRLSEMSGIASFPVKDLKEYVPHYFGWYQGLKRLFRKK